MAEQKSSVFVSRPVIISILAALGIAGAVAAPTVVDCASADAGFGTCVRQKLESVGVVPAAQPEAADETDQGELVANLSDATAEVEAADATTEPAPDASPLINARVEPDGSAVLVGSASPNSEIHFFANGEPIGSTTTDDVGDWVFIPDQPLPAGGVALTTNIGELMGADDSQPDSLAIVVDPDGASEPQVVAGNAAQVGQTLTDLTGMNPLAATPEAAAEPGAAEMEVAAVEPQAEVAQEEQPSDRAVTTPIVEPEQVAEAETPATPAAETAPAETAEPVAAESETPADMEVAAIEPQTTAPAAEQTPIVAVPDIAPSIDAVEIDGSANFIAGAGTDGTTVKLFVDDVLVGQTIVDGGRWLVEAQDALTSSNQRIRAEFISPDGQTIDAQPEVNFVIAGLEPDQTAQVSDATAVEQTGLSLSAESLAPAILPTEAPFIPAETEVADTSPVATPGEPTTATGDIVLPEDQLAPIALPVTAPLVVAEGTPAETEMAAGEETQPAEVTTGEETQPSEMTGEQPAAEAAPTAEAPAIIEQPAGETPVEPQMAAETSQDAASEAPAESESPSATNSGESDAQPAPAADQQATEEEPVTEPPVSAEIVIPADQLAPAEMPTVAPAVPAPADEPAADAAPSAESSAAAAEESAPASEDVIIPADQLAPAELPTEAPPVPVEPETPVADAQPNGQGDSAPATESAATPQAVEIPADQLAPAELPTSAPPVPAPTVARGASSGDTLIPVDQVPLAEMPTEAPAVPGLSQAEGDEVPTLTVVAVGEPGENRFASGKVIIRRGDNLWTISRRVYGFGRDYVRIFEANRDKIENPHWIYPGQVFELPSGE